jgi:predicted AAA+ superfamily ATPase
MLRRALAEAPVVALLGPRQCGKTTLAREVARGREASIFDLEDPADLASLDAPKAAIESLKGLVVLDEVQRKPDLLPLLRVLADRPRTPARFLVLGSASPHLVRGVSESLAGRVRFVEMGGFDVREAGPDRHATLWLRGGFPRSFLAPSEVSSLAWRESFIRTFLERDVPQLGITVPAPTLRRFWAMVAHVHGQVWNAADLARSLGTSEPTARRYLDLLTGAYVLRQVPPWFENIAKRQVKSPKVYVRDVGLLHALLSLRTRKSLLSHPKCGASWEGFVVEQVLALARPAEAYFWGTHAGAELDLMIVRDGRRIGFEAKFEDAPRTTRSMHIALDTLRLQRLYVVHPGAKSYRLTAKIDALSVLDLARTLG